MTARAVIFDFGGVFIDSPFTAALDVAEQRGIDPGMMLGTVFGSYEDDTDHPWHRLERGEIGFDQARTEIIDASEQSGGPRLDPVELLAVLGGGGVRDEVVEHCRALRRRGLRTGLLTNNAAEFAEFWRPMIPLGELFDDVVDSCEVGMRKPDPRVYRLALERLGVEAEHTVFVDDAPGNIAGAAAVGLRTVLMGPRRSDAAAAIEQIDRLVDAAPGT
jgi:putative hydrolase of the HAD superfamily